MYSHCAANYTMREYLMGESYLAGQFRQIKCSLAEQFRKIKCSFAEQWRFNRKKTR